ncbi:MAG TPA: cytochrome c oxidase assembly protein [Acidimicrobiales bacterium]|nr:cytochrome c oxidase assembly protein [Acidimicrobiales bacterium]
MAVGALLATHPSGAALSGVRAGVLLTGVQTAAPALAAAGAEVAAAGLYLWGVRRLAGRGRRWPVRRTLAFMAGLTTIWLAVGSGLAAYDETSVTLHMVQHVLLMTAAPPLLALGRPLALATQAARRPAQVRLNRLLRSGPVAALTHPLPAAVLYFGTMWVMLVDRPAYDYLIADQPAHRASHVLLLAVGLLYWTPLVAPDTARHRLSHPARVVLLLLSMPLEALPGVFMRFRSTPIDAINSLADTRTAGELFLVAATGACSLWLVAVVVQWFAFAVREERRQASGPDGAGGAWTVPWWIGPATPPVAASPSGPSEA